MNFLLIKSRYLDKLCQNNFLKEIANEIKKQINEIESINHKSAEDEQLIKFLGKVFYNGIKYLFNY